VKTTLDLPDDLYRQVKSKAAMQGRAVREVTIELYQRFLAEVPESSKSLNNTDWLDEWVRFGAELERRAPPGPTLREILDEDRGRLER
jgi:hypothetical protein